ncbi:MAG TPA: hypothetical protein PLY23_01380 [Alphaproteobacteria bacterium]|nr:hypothetical protein [Alphaproteobacteria bacterium]
MKVSLHTAQALIRPVIIADPAWVDAIVKLSPYHGVFPESLLRYSSVVDVRSFQLGSS